MTLGAILAFLVGGPANALAVSESDAAELGAPDSEAASLAKAIAFRESVGFVDDADTVRATLVDDRYSSAEWGVPLSPEELANLARRVDVREQIAPAFALASDLPGTAGNWVDQHDDGTPVFMSTADAKTVTATISAMIPDGIPVRVEQVELSLKDLYALRAQVLADSDRLRAAGINLVSVGINPSVNGVSVGIERGTAEGLDQLRARYGAHIVVRELGKLQGGDSCSSREVCLPLKGGIKIYRSGYESSQYCTLGMIVRKSLSTILYALTAGHCIENSGGTGIRWKHNTTTFGTAVAETWAVGSDADAGLIQIDTEDYPTVKNEFYAASTSDIRDFTSSVAASNQTIGDFVCRSGLVSGYNCGYIVDTDDTLDVDGKAIDHQWSVDFDGCKGDSGGPYYFQHSVWGIHTDSVDGCNPASGTAWYSPVTWVANRLVNYGWPIAMCLTATC